MSVQGVPAGTGRTKVRALMGAEGRPLSRKQTLETTLEDGSENLRHKICWRIVRE